MQGSIVDQIIRRSGELDVYVISSAAEGSPLREPTTTGSRLFYWSQYAQSVGLIGLATLLGYPLRSVVEPTNLVMLYLLAVVIAALRLGHRPAILASLLSVAAFNFFFVPPYYTYVVADAQYLLTFAALLIVALLTSTLAARIREQARAAHRRETQTAALYELNRDLTGVTDPVDMSQVVVSHIQQVFAGEAAVWLMDQAGELDLGTASSGFTVNELEWEAAAWTAQHRQPAGRETDTLSDRTGLYLPLTVARHGVGVLGIQPAETADPLTPDRRRLLAAFATQAAQAIERIELAAEANQARLLRETEKLQSALLNSISHDLRTPLASITGALSSLREDALVLDETAQGLLINTAWEQAERLNALVGNLLEMTRLEAGATRTQVVPCDLQDVVGVTLSKLDHRLASHPIRLGIPPDLPFIPLDFVLAAQALGNVVDNAIKYSPAQAEITIQIRPLREEIVIEVLDEGIGIPAADLEAVFNKFYRVQRRDGVGGTGLGLSISRGIVEAHGGRIWAENRPGGGTLVAMSFPMEESGQ